eukprot:CAMPEP_0198223840 /NCGR_PEP_ID=MMETSP1445-20131203/94221_1 /TAXON_ID=36898 /ORGANISM="Pyramimonas sp., Strain CCMP2087" /LENGTH=483 /DNA_ID=CAMNT_0043902807 /DNA_START=385 /DNA_END=1836 /DNA_ORIENTATION=+
MQNGFGVLPKAPQRCRLPEPREEALKILRTSPVGPSHLCRASTTPWTTTLLFTKRAALPRSTFIALPVAPITRSNNLALSLHRTPRSKLSMRLGLKLYSSNLGACRISLPCTRTSSQTLQAMKRRGRNNTTRCFARESDASSEKVVSIAALETETGSESNRIAANAVEKKNQGASKQSTQNPNSKVSEGSDGGKQSKPREEATQEVKVDESADAIGKETSAKKDPRVERCFRPTAAELEWQTCLEKKDMKGLSLALHKHIALGGRPRPSDYKRIVQEMSLRGRSDLAYKLYVQLAPEGFKLNPAVFRLLITACAKADQYDDALAVFGAYKAAGHPPSLTVYTTLIANLARNARKKNRKWADGMRALALWTELCSLQITLDQGAVNAGVMAAGAAGDTDLAEAIMRALLRDQDQSTTQQILGDMSTLCQRSILGAPIAAEVMAGLETFNTLITLYGERQDGDQVEATLVQMVSKDVPYARTNVP